AVASAVAVAVALAPATILVALVERADLDRDRGADVDHLRAVADRDLIHHDPVQVFVVDRDPFDRGNQPDPLEPAHGLGLGEAGQAWDPDGLALAVAHAQRYRAPQLEPGAAARRLRNDRPGRLERVDALSDRREVRR